MGKKGWFRSELFKTIVLLFLVVLSIIQTIILWEYHPRYESLQTEEIDEVDRSLQRSIEDTILPTQIIAMTQGNIYESVHEPKMFMQSIRDSFRIEGFSPLAARNVVDLSTGVQNGVEIVLPEPQHLNTLRYMFPGKYNLSGKIPQRALYYTKQDRWYVRLLMSDGTLWESTLATNGDVQTTDLLKHEGREMLAVRLPDERVIYMPKEGPELEEWFAYDISTTDIPSRLDWMRETFFPGDPSVQQFDPNPTVGALTNGIGVAEYDAVLNASRYRNLSRNSGSGETQLNVDAVIDYVNFHGGWIDSTSEKEGVSLRFDSLNPDGENDYETILFRFHVKGFPIFSERQAFINSDTFDLSTLRLENDGVQVRSIVRPHLEVERLIQVGKTRLEDGEKVLKTLRDEGRFENVTDIRIGYELKHSDDESRYVTFSPMWFVKEAGRWVPYDRSEEWAERMMYHGLE